MAASFWRDAETQNASNVTTLQTTTAVDDNGDSEWLPACAFGPVRFFSRHDLF
jgi:hypothetical protein